MNTDKISIIEQSPATTNSVAETKPYVQKTYNVLEGYIANSFNGGILKPVAYKRIMAGEKIVDYSISGIMRMLTPKVPTMQKLETTFKAFFVPNSRVWTNAEKYTAQKGASTVTKIKKRPVAQPAAKLPIIPDNIQGTGGYNYAITDTDIWRDSYISTYVPRLYTTSKTLKSAANTLNMYEFDYLPLRGFKAIYNDMLRHKIYDLALTEYKDDTISDGEYNSFFPALGLAPGQTKLSTIAETELRGRRKDSYYTNYTTAMEGVDNTIIPMYTDLMQHTEWQKLIAESRTEVQNQQKNDWDIVAQIRGSRPVQDGKVQFLGMKTVGMNYTQVSQTSYNTNPNIGKEYQTLGQTGAFSYTEFDVSMINYHEFKEEGYIHIIAQTSADTVFETGLDRMLLNTTSLSEYRPDYKDLKNDVLYNEESGTFKSNNNGQLTTQGYKRKFSEYFKLPNCINGDMTNSTIYKTVNGELSGNPVIVISDPIALKKEFQFFEESETYTTDPNNIENKIITKYGHQDYTDLLINKNQAIRNEIITIGANDSGRARTTALLQGENQIFFMAIARCINDMPIDDNIKNDFKKWGEA